MAASSTNVAGLIALSGLGWTLAENLFVGGLKDGDDVAAVQAAVSIYSGTADETFGSSWMRPQAQVMIRGDRDSYAEAEAKAYALWAYLANIKNVQVPLSIGVEVVGPLLIQALTPTGTVNPLGTDDQQRSLFSMNFTVTV
jgi:hypothetical protein